MYGTIARLHPLPGNTGDVETLSRQWIRDRAPHVEGFIAGYVLRAEADAGNVFLLSIFDSKANYRKNADDPDQDRWYRNFRAVLAQDPEWNDGEITALEPETVPL